MSSESAPDASESGADDRPPEGTESASSILDRTPSATIDQILKALEALDKLSTINSDYVRLNHMLTHLDKQLERGIENISETCSALKEMHERHRDASE